MKHFNFFYFLREGIKSIFTHRLMSIAAITTIVACLLITGSFCLLAYNVNDVIKKAEQENEILAFVEDNLTDTEALALANKIYTIDNVKSAEFISRDEAFENYSKELGDYSELLDGLESDVLRHRYRIFVKDLGKTSDTADNIYNIQGIGSVRYSFEIADGIVTLQNVVNAVTYIITALLLLVSIFMISNTVKLTTHERQKEIAIMKMVGATNRFIRWPFIVEGFLLGMTGGFLAYFAEWGLYTYAGDVIANYAPAFQLIPFGSLMMYLLVAFLATGFIVGTFGGASTIQKYMKV